MTGAGGTRPAPADRGTWLRGYRPAEQARVQLVCLPHAGGSASFFVPLSRLLAPDVEVLAVQYPGRQDRRAEPPVEDLRVLAGQVTAVLGPPDGRPRALFGHSMGAVVAYEVALALQDAGTPPARVFASGRRAPSRYRAERVHERDDRGVLDELSLLDGTEGAVLADPEIVAMVMPALRADYRAIETYRHEPGRSLECPVTVLVGDADPRTSLAEARAWSDHTRAGTDVRVLPGGHFFLVAAAGAVAAAVAGALLGPGDPA